MAYETLVPQVSDVADEAFVKLVVVHVFSFDYTGIVKQKDRPGRKIYPCMY